MTQVELIKDVDRYFDLLTDDSVEVQNLRFVNDEVLEAHYIYHNNFIPPNGRTNAVIAAFTTAHARLKLYDVLDSLGDRVLYYDTDSIIFVSREGEWEPSLGDYLGQLTSETGNQYITTFVSGGPKNYAYKLCDETTHCKVRGITLNYRNSLIINFDLLKEMVRTESDALVPVYNPCKIVRDVKNKQILSRAESKDYRIVYNKRVIKDDYNTVPYGYKFR